MTLDELYQALYDYFAATPPKQSLHMVLGPTGALDAALATGANYVNLGEVPEAIAQVRETAGIRNA